MLYDLLIKNGKVVDGTGAAAYQADVAVSAGKIIEIGRLQDQSKAVIHATGLVVAPGFIDPHTHYDAQICWDPLVTCSSWHGVTSVLMGNCGVGIAPCKIQDRQIVTWDLVNVEAIPFDVLNQGIRWEWQSFPEYMDAAQRRKKAINLGFLAPLTPFRHFVMGYEESINRAANDAEMVAIAALLKEAVSAGAMGFSVSTVHHIGYQGRPLGSRRASRAELGTYAAALKDLGKGVIEITLLDVPGMMSDAEFDLLDLLLTKSERPVTWITLTSRADRPDTCANTLARAEPLIRRGGVPQINCRPTTVLLDLKDPYLIRISGFESWKRVLDQPLDVQKRVLRDPEFRTAFRIELLSPRIFRGNWERIEVRTASSPALKSLEGRTVAQIAHQRGRDPLDTFLDLALEDDLNLYYATTSDTGEIPKLVADSRTILGLSDAGAHLGLLCDAGYCTYLLGVWAREKQVLTLERAVKRLTSEPADYFGISTRGRLLPGLAADITIFDYDQVMPGPVAMLSDLPGGGRRLVQEARGIQYTIVNGEVVYDNGKHTGALPGAVLRSGSC
jgi:N-acyl-D-aspartate/D-glutamate deacylase